MSKYFATIFCCNLGLSPTKLRLLYTRSDTSWGSKPPHIYERSNGSKFGALLPGLPRYIAIYDISRYLIFIAIRDISFGHIAIQMCTGIDGVARG